MKQLFGGDQDLIDVGMGRVLINFWYELRLDGGRFFQSKRVREGEILKEVEIKELVLRDGCGRAGVMGLERKGATAFGLHEGFRVPNIIDHYFLFQDQSVSHWFSEVRMGVRVLLEQARLLAGWLGYC